MQCLKRFRMVFNTQPWPVLIVSTTLNNVATRVNATDDGKKVGMDWMATSNKSVKSVVTRILLLLKAVVAVVVVAIS